MIDYNYPVKYAVLEVKEAGGWLNGYEDITIGYIVSKCYLIESRIRYYRNGINEMVHEVFFPYNDITSYKRCGRLSDRKYPRLDACNRIYDTTIVKDLFDTYDDAVILKRQLKGEFSTERLSEIWIKHNVGKEKSEEYIRDISKNLEICDRYEMEIEEELTDMKISQNIKKLKLTNR